MAFCKRVGQLLELAHRNMVFNNHIFFQNIPQLSDMIGKNRRFFAAEEGTIHDITTRYNALKKSIIDPDEKLSQEAFKDKSSMYNTDLNNAFKALAKGTTLEIAGNRRVLSSQDLLRNKQTIQEFITDYSDLGKHLTTDAQRAQMVDLIWVIKELLRR